MPKFVTIAGGFVSVLAFSPFPATANQGNTFLHGADMHETLDKMSRLLQSIKEGRSLKTTKQDCDTFLALTITPVIEQCNALTSSIQALAPTQDAQCNTVTDFSKSKLDGICSNKCYSILVDALGKMSKSGCAPDTLLKNMCDQCPGGTKCVQGACLSACSSKSPCKCNEICTNGACMPSQATFQQTDFGTNGYKVSLEHLCLIPPDSTNDDYCFSSVFTAFDGLSPGVCDRVKGTGCCAGTMMQYGVTCALANETIGTSMGPIKLSDMAAFCPDVDFKTKCANVPEYTDGSCVNTYQDGPGEELPFPAMSSMGGKGFSLLGVYAIVGGIAAMALVVATVSIAQNLSNARRIAAAKAAAESQPPQIQTPNSSV